MIKPKAFDGIIETVRYAPDGKIQWVRAYARHGFVFSDHFLLGREQLIERLKAGQRFFTGQRRPYQGNDFEVQKAIRLVQHGGQDYVVVGESSAAAKDQLTGVPIF